MEKSRGIPYTYGYYSSMNTNHARFVLASNGVKPPIINTACELGFGQGLTLAINSATSGAKWYGTDIEPMQVAFAEGLSSHYKDRCRIYGQSFEEFRDNPELGEFDFICLHGIWTWVSNADRKIICELVGEKLRPGGLLYISYNTLPAWSTFMPVQKLMRSFCDNHKSVNLDPLSNLTESFKFIEKLMGAEPKYLKANPTIQGKLKGLIDQSDNYLVHEYLASDFKPMTFDEAAGWLTPLNMDYVCSATVFDDNPVLNLTSKQAEFLSEIKNPIFRETCKDLMVNKDFRAEYWIKGGEKLSKQGYPRELDKFSLMLTRPSEDIKLEFKGALGVGNADESVYRPLITILGDHEIWSYSDTIKAMVERGIEEGKTADAIKNLFGIGCIAPIDREGSKKANKGDVKSLNDKIMQRSIEDNLDINTLASSVIGGGVSVNKITQMHIQDLQSGLETATQLGESALRKLQLYERKVIQDGKTLQTEKENLDYLVNHAQEFLVKSAPICRAFEII